MTQIRYHVELLGEIAGDPQQLSLWIDGAGDDTPLAEIQEAAVRQTALDRVVDWQIARYTATPIDQDTILCRRAVVQPWARGRQAA